MSICRVFHHLILIALRKMFSKTSVFTTLALAAPLFVRAVVTPSEPGPGSVYAAGETCRVVWAGDTESDTLWADMSIQLMTGSNFEMVHVTSECSCLRL